MTIAYVARLLAQAKNAAGDRAVGAATLENYAKAREWQALAAEIDRLLRAAVEADAA